MALPVGKWRVSLYLNEVCECTRATVSLAEEGVEREIIKMLPGPFDDPNDLLSTIIELIDHAEWHGEQLRLPVPAVDD